MKHAEKKAQLDTVLYNLAECLRIICLVLKPIIPDGCTKMQHGLGLEPDDERMRSFATGVLWGGLESGVRLNSIDALFPRLQTAKTPAPRQAKKKQNQSTKQKRTDSGEATSSLISFEQFKALELKVARIVKAERIPNSDRLLKLRVEAPEERTIVAGIAHYYEPAELENKNVIIVANLKPAKLMGIVSEGLVLTAQTVNSEGERGLEVLSVGENCDPGSRIS